MSIFDKENIVTEEYLSSKKFQRDNCIASPYMDCSDRFILQIYDARGYLLANIFYYLDESNDPDSPQYMFYIGYKRKNDIIETWSSEIFYNIKDQVDFEVCLKKALQIIKVNYKI